jgi:hypothetical protein
MNGNDGKYVDECKDHEPEHWKWSLKNSTQETATNIIKERKMDLFLDMGKETEQLHVSYITE